MPGYMDYWQQGLDTSEKRRKQQEAQQYGNEMAGRKTTGQILGGLAGAVTGGLAGGGLAGMLSGAFTGASTAEDNSLGDVAKSAIGGGTAGANVRKAQLEEELMPFKKMKELMPAADTFYNMFEPVEVTGTPPPGAVKVPDMLVPYFGSKWALPRTNPFKKGSNVSIFTGG